MKYVDFWDVFFYLLKLFCLYIHKLLFELRIISINLDFFKYFEDFKSF